MAQFIFYHGAVNIQGARNLETLLSKAVGHEKPEITLCICSGGGDVCAGIGVYNFIRMLPVPVTTYAFGLCGSIAATMYLAGSRRISAAASRFTLHAATYVEGPRKDEVSENTAVISLPFKTTLQWPDERLQKYFSSPVEQFMTPEEAQAFGIVTEVSDLKMAPTDEQVHVHIP